MHELFYLAVIWMAVFTAHFVAAKTRLTPVLWFLAAGCLLVNTGVLPEQPVEFIAVFSEIGIIVIMFALGFEENPSNFIASIKRSWGIALFGAIAPFCIAYWLALQFWGEPNVALMCGLAMTATAVSLTMVSLKSEGMNKTPAATGIMTSAVLDDIASLAAVAIMVPIALGEGEATVGGILMLLANAVAFFAIIMFMGAWLFPIESGPLARIPVIRHFNLRMLIGLEEGEHATLTVLLIALLVALLGHKFGFHPAVGAYMAGLILKEEFFLLSKDSKNPPLSNPVYLDTSRIIDNVAFSWIGPVFFVNLGAHIILDLDLLIEVLDKALLLFCCLFVGQVVSAGLAARYTGGFSKSDSLLIGLGMLGRAELAFVVMDIAYVQNNILSQHAFYTLMVTAFMLNIAVPLSIRRWKRSYGFSPTEEAS